MYVLEERWILLSIIAYCDDPRCGLTIDLFEFE